MICIIDCGSIFVNKLKENLKELSYKVEVIKFEEVLGYDLELYSGIIISGRPTLLTQENIPELIHKLHFIKNAEIPVLGICFGHQIIGLISGSKINVGKSIDKKEDIEIIKENSLFKGIKNLPLFKEAHSEYISLPENFVLLAKSESCGNEA